MDDVPKRPDPRDSTEPLPESIPPTRMPLDGTRAVRAPLPDARGTSDEDSAAYVHRFGPKPFYLFARLVAFLMDGCGLTFVLATFAFNAKTHGSFLGAAHGESGYIAILAGAFAIAVVFAFACEALFGTTIGKLVFALHVRTLSGRHVRAGPVLIRTLLYPVDLLLVGLLLAAMTRRRQRLGDMLAKTVVSNGSIGAFASVIGVALVIALAYAQAAYAGGVDSLDGFASQTRQYAPGIAAQVTSLFRGADGGLPAVAPSGSPAPSTMETSAAPAVPSANPSTENPIPPSSELATEAPTLPPPSTTPVQAASPVDASPNP